MGLMKKLTSAIVASSLVLGLVGTAAADYSPAGVNEAAARMKALGVVKGVETPTGPDLMLNKPITRAELVTIIVRAFGKEDLAKLLKGSPSFSDSAEHWASGEIAMAKNIIESKGHTLGVTPTTFVPNKEVSSAEAIAFVMKFLGVKENTTLSWPMNFIQGAVDAGLITEADKATLSVAPNSPAIRGLVFYLADHAFHTYKMADTGKTAYTSYLDTTAPTLSVDAAAATTEAKSVTVTGKVSGHQVLHVSTTAGDTSAVVEADLDGTWSATLDLKVGANEIWVHAVDIAGNVATSSATVTRVAGAAAKVEATLSSASVAAGGTADLAVVVKDANNIEIASPEFTVTVEGNIGTYADGVFTAANTTGTGKLNITAGAATTSVDVTVVAGPIAKVEADTAAAAPGAKVTLTAKDALGNTVTGATFTVDSADAVVDSSTGVFVAFKAGNYTVTAKAGDTTVTTAIGVYGTAAKLGLTVGGKVVGNYDAGSDKGTAQTVTVKVLDANGNLRTDSTAAVTLAGTGLTVKGAVSGNATENAANGVATFKVYAPAAMRGQIIGLTATSGTLTQATGNLEVAPQVATKVDVAVDSNFIGVTAAETMNFTVKVLDQEGVQMRTGSWDAKVEVSGPVYLNETGSVTSKTYSVVNGTSTGLAVKNVLYSTGGATVTATVDGLGSASKTFNAVVVGSAKALTLEASKTEYTSASTSYVTFTATVVDAQGAKIAGSAAPATIELDLSALTVAQKNALTLLAGSTGATALTETGVNTKKFTVNQDAASTNSYTFRVGTKAGDPIGKFAGDLNVKIKSGDLTAAEKLITVKAGAAAQVKLTSTATRYVPVAAPSASFTAQLYDAQGNAVKKADVDVTFTSTADVSFDGTATTKTVKTDAEGKATVTATAKQFVGNTYQVEVSSGTLTQANYQANITVDSTATASVSMVIEKDAGGGTWVIPSFITAGDIIRFKATVKDTYGVARLDHTSLKVTSAESIVWDGAKNIKADDATITFPATSTNGTYVSNGIQVGKAGLVSFSIKDENVTGVTADASVLVYAGDANKANIAEADSNSNLYVTQNSISPAFTVKLTDAYGNEVSSNATVSIAIAIGGAEAAKVHARSSVDGLATTSLSTRNVVQFFLGVTDLAKTGTPATITLTPAGGAASVFTVIGK